MTCEQRARRSREPTCARSPRDRPCRGSEPAAPGLPGRPESPDVPACSGILAGIRKPSRVDGPPSSCGDTRRSQNPEPCIARKAGPRRLLSLREH